MRFIDTSKPCPSKNITPRLSVPSVVCRSYALGKESSAKHVDLPRRNLLAGAIIALTTASVPPSQAVPLAPLGEIKRIGGDKLIGLSVDEVKDILAKDLSVGQYFVTGNLTREIFADDCRFVDPTNDVTGLSKYVTALGILFDPDWSKVLLKGIRVTGDDTIVADYVSGGYLKEKYFPWRPRVAAYEGHVEYTLNAQGLIQLQRQTWSISPGEALRQTFTPTSGPKTPVICCDEQGACSTQCGGAA
mmetsp:Transcript_26025/g.56771  ORF Transcript_26025/g.56771 Transcript_26025/m.56771 type:complete len:246 (+) Transcript_26025:50-787(+)